MGGDAFWLGRLLQAWRKVMAAYTAGWMASSHLRADCLYTKISSGPNAQ